MLWGKTSRPAPRVSTLVPFIKPALRLRVGLVLWNTKMAMSCRQRKNAFSGEIIYAGRATTICGAIINKLTAESHRKEPNPLLAVLRDNMKQHVPMTCSTSNLAVSREHCCPLKRKVLQVGCQLYLW